jgi:hypothetical protein
MATSLLESLAQAMTPDAIGKLSQAVGLDTSQSQKALEIAGPLLLGSLARKSATTSGMDSIMRMLPDPNASGGGLLSQLLGSAGQSNPLSAMSTLSGILGPGIGTIGKALGGRLGFNVAPLLAAVAPTILGAIGTKAREENLNPADIASLLQKEHASAIANAKPHVKTMVDEAFQLGDRAESLKAKFNDQEWSQIRLSPLAVTFYIVSANPSGATGIAKEVIAAGDAMHSIVKDALPMSLIDVAFSSLNGRLDLDGKLEEPVSRPNTLARLHSAAATVRAKSPVDAKSFGDAMVALSRKVAEASKEGGFLGFGGTLVSKEEEQAIAEIATALHGGAAVA